MSTHSSSGDGQKLASKILFSEVTRQRSIRGGICNLLTAGTHNVIASDEQKMQSNPGAPITVIRDLSKTHGDSVTVDVLHEATEAPRMGDELIEGNEENITRSNFNIQIDQYRKAIKMGGKMTQQRRGYSMVKAGKQILTSYFPRLKSEIMLAHIAGARGSYRASDVILPTGGELLKRVLVNPLTAPTYDRTFYGGAATSIGAQGAVTAGDRFNRDALRRLRSGIDEMAHPPRAVDLSTEDKPMNTDPFYLLLVSPRQWADFKETEGEFSTLVANATKRMEGYNHTLFKGEMFMDENILVRKNFHPVRFNTGDTVQVCEDSNDATEAPQTVGNGVTVDRAILLGAQSLGWAFGGTTGGMAFEMINEKYDSKNKHRSTIEWMGGMAKIRFRDRDGRLNDYGTCVLDTAV